MFRMFKTLREQGYPIIFCVFATLFPQAADAVLGIAARAAASAAVVKTGDDFPLYEWEQGDMKETGVWLVKNYPGDGVLPISGNLFG